MDEHKATATKNNLRANFKKVKARTVTAYRNANTAHDVYFIGCGKTRFYRADNAD
jgi:hypothetical protein